ncbi:NUDIX hydrolase [Streptomyces sp. NPDC090052]|uniref:NUDIX hydrolase n=1 Tax=Streptomyces sp. NPDC090052 TaxID=3365931 RepID=UPI0037FB0D25
MTTLPVRPAARVIALDGDGQVLLLRYEENGGFWATPGGSLDRGEDHTEALRRELGEELGVDGDRVRLGPQLAERTSDHKVGDGDVRQIERYYIARLTEADLNLAQATQADTITATRWWSINDLNSTRETVYPLGLGDLITSYQTQGAPERPAILR